MSRRKSSAVADLNPPVSSAESPPEVNELVGLPTSAETRREGVPGVPVRLADGDVWYLASAGRRFVPRFGPGDVVTVSEDYGFPPAIAGPLATLRNELARRGPGGAIPLPEFFTTALAMLRWCHRIDPEAGCRLLNVGADGFAEILEAMLFAASGGFPENGGSADDATAEPPAGDPPR